jgi:hypothetical protein
MKGVKRMVYALLIESYFMILGLLLAIYSDSSWLAGIVLGWAMPLILSPFILGSWLIYNLVESKLTRYTQLPANVGPYSSDLDLVTEDSISDDESAWFIGIKIEYNAQKGGSLYIEAGTHPFMSTR